MEVFETAIPAVRRVVPRRHGDARGWFCEIYRADQLAAAGIANVLVQDNQSFSAPAHTIRGLHFQTPPAAEAKLVRLLAGSILGAAVDLRRASPTYGRHVAVRLDATGGEQLFVPAGFAHGFCTLESDTMVAYKFDAYYSPANDRNPVWNDPDLAIAWPIGEAEAALSDKDRAAPRLADLGPVF
ncbi:dTDP-4-dehydrorhamnose 3,5-epimerase [Methylobacterium iners]|uniref:dTDP-4-dehydrorhamnose 3,5-epimerase n=1 Tax=Methylobacterium iners TaxID=418707 RepID=A0ABQ4S5T7_9HYPH|nr:dTDP-4-dehydrorhamnose 3,5-epimerase [Methylobacterium iners]GJD97864.1 dTDP-4-dehydrorhamnose 3,5-epimerase [Methylobacterium iners]